MTTGEASVFTHSSVEEDRRRKKKRSSSSSLSISIDSQNHGVMTKVFPNATAIESPRPSPIGDDASTVAGEAVAMTVWRKSLLFNCKGFTVFDSKGNLVFRVDSYSSGSKGEIVLMDGAGKPLLTIRRKRLSLGENWLIFDGEEAINPRFSVKKHVTLLHSKGLANVTSCGRTTTTRRSYTVEGSYSQRSFAVHDDRRRPVAEVRRKEAARGVALGGDVFSLVVQPGIETPLAMAFVILLDQMFGS